MKAWNRALRVRRSVHTLGVVLLLALVSAAVSASDDTGNSRLLGMIPEDFRGAAASASISFGEGEEFGDSVVPGGFAERLWVDEDESVFTIVALLDYGEEQAAIDHLNDVSIHEMDSFPLGDEGYFDTGKDVAGNDSLRVLVSRSNEFIVLVASGLLSLEATPVPWMDLHLLAEGILSLTSEPTAVMPLSGSDYFAAVAFMMDLGKGWSALRVAVQPTSDAPGSSAAAAQGAQTGVLPVEGTEKGLGAASDSNECPGKDDCYCVSIVFWLDSIRLYTVTGDQHEWWNGDDCEPVFGGDIVLTGDCPCQTDDCAAGYMADGPQWFFSGKRYVTKTIDKNSTVYFPPYRSSEAFVLGRYRTCVCESGEFTYRIRFLLADVDEWNAATIARVVAEPFKMLPGPAGGVARAVGAVAGAFEDIYNDRTGAEQSASPGFAKVTEAIDDEKETVGATDDTAHKMRLPNKNDPGNVGTSQLMLVGGSGGRGEDNGYITVKFRVEKEDTKCGTCGPKAIPVGAAPVPPTTQRPATPGPATPGPATPGPTTPGPGTPGPTTPGPGTSATPPGTAGPATATPASQPASAPAGTSRPATWPVPAPPPGIPPTTGSAPKTPVPTPPTEENGAPTGLPGIQTNNPPIWWDPFPNVPSDDEAENGSAPSWPIDDLSGGSPIWWSPPPIPSEIEDCVRQLGYDDGTESRQTGWEYQVGPDCSDCCVQCMVARLEIWLNSGLVTRDQRSCAQMVWAFFTQASPAEQEAMAAIYAQAFWDAY